MGIIRNLSFLPVLQAPYSPQGDLPRGEIQAPLFQVTPFEEGSLTTERPDSPLKKAPSTKVESPVLNTSELEVVIQRPIAGVQNPISPAVEMENLRPPGAASLSSNPPAKVIVDSGMLHSVEKLPTHPPRNAAVMPNGRMLSTGLNIFGGGLSVVVAIAEVEQAYQNPNFLNLIGAGAGTVSAAGFLTAGAARMASVITPIRPGALIFVEQGMFVGQFAGGAVAAVLGMRYLVEDSQDENASWLRISTGPLMALGGAGMSYAAWLGSKTTKIAASLAQAKRVVRNPLTIAGLALMAGEAALGIGREYAIEYDTSKALSQAISPTLLRRGRRVAQKFDRDEFESKLAPLIKNGHLDDDVVRELVQTYSGKNTEAKNFLQEAVFTTPLFVLDSKLDRSQIPHWMHEKSLLEIFDGVVTGKGEWNYVYSKADKETHGLIQENLKLKH